MHWVDRMQHIEARRVLVVDTSPTWCLYVADALPSDRYRVDWTADPRVALEKLDVDRHDLAIVDATLGRGRGAEVVAALRNVHPGLRVIVTSAAVTCEDVEQAERAGAFFVPKPLHHGALRKLVDACLTPAP